MYVRFCFVAIDEGDDMRVLEVLEDINLGIQVLLKLLVELRKRNGLDCHESICAL